MHLKLHAFALDISCNCQPTIFYMHNSLSAVIYSCLISKNKHSSCSLTLVPRGSKAGSSESEVSFGSAVSLIRIELSCDEFHATSDP